MKPRKTIILIEDSPTQAQQIAAFMSQFEIDVSVASTARQGLRLIDAFPPDAIILDLYMPDMDGFQLCRRLKRDSNTSYIPVVIVTASTKEQDAEMGVKVGVDKYLKKDDKFAENLLKTLKELDAGV